MLTKLLATVVVTLCMTVSALADEPLFKESFEGLSKWTRLAGKAPTLGQLEADGTSMRCMLLANSVAKADLPQKVEESFVLSFLAINNAYQRSLWVGVFNADGSKGYAASWNTNSETNFHGQGSVSVSKFDLVKAVTWKDALGTVISERVESGQKAVGGWPALFELSWDKPSHTFVLRVNGVEKVRAVDASFQSFSTICARGNERSVIANITLTKAEQAQPTK